MACLPIAALAQDGSELPPSAQPGASEPDRDERQRTPEQPPGPVLEVPPMIERPLDPEEGPSVAVESFELKGAQDRRARGIRVDEIEALLARARERRPEGFTIGQLQQVANEVTRYYREHGLILAKAVVPEQTVDDGVVEIRVIEGTLGSVRPQGNELYGYATLRRPFGDLVDEPVSQKRTEAALLTLTDYPGLAAFGVFEPGKEPGEADMILKVQEEDAVEGSVRLDNHGSETSGQGRVRARLDWNNVSDSADRLRLTALHSFDPANTAFGRLAYKRIFGRRYAMDVFVSANEFEVGGELESLGVEGETYKLGASVGRQWIRSRQRNLSTDLSLEVKRSRTFVLGQQDNEDALTVLGLETEFDFVDTRFDGLNFGGIELYRGLNDTLGSMGDSDSSQDEPLGERPSRRTDDGEFAEGQFTKLFAYYSRLQNITSGQSLLVRTELQYTEDLLVPLEQYSVGGPNNVRAFPSSHALLDQAGLVSAEYVIDAPFLSGTAFGSTQWSELASVTAFYDHLAGQLNEPGVGEPDDTVTFSGAGVSLRLSWASTLEGQVQLAWPLEENEEIADAEAVDSPQLWGSLTYRF
jgi:hemolysin activation/secretion protein